VWLGDWFILDTVLKNPDATLRAGVANFALVGWSGPEKKSRPPS
jgi:hypothetical protein